MTNAARQKGTAFETAIVAHIREHGVPADRLARTGTEDEGDVIAGYAPRYFILEAKATRTIDLAGAIDEAESGARNYARHRNPDDLFPAAAVIKRRNHGIGDAYVVMRLHTFVGILAQ